MSTFDDFMIGQASEMHKEYDELREVNRNLIAQRDDLLEAVSQCLIFLAPHQRPAPEEVYTAVLESIRKAEVK